MLKKGKKQAQIGNINNSGIGGRRTKIKRQKSDHSAFRGKDQTPFMPHTHISTSN